MQGGWLARLLTRDPSTTPGGVSRRGFIQSGVAAGVAAAGGVLGGTQVAQAQPAPAAAQETPIGPRWWPSRWGPQDEAGASNWITPQKVLAAVRLIKTGKIYE